MKQPVERSIVKVTKDAKSKLAILAKRNDKTELDYASEAITFIYKSGIDVYTKVTPNIPDLVKNLERRIIGFMKKRESDFFVPMNEKMVALTENHIKLFDALETFDVVKFATQNTDKDKPTFKVPDQDLVSDDASNEMPLEKGQIVGEKEGLNTTILNEDLKAQNELLLGQLEKAKKQKEIFEKELGFLISRVTKSGALGGGKFMLNITQRDLERINKILDDN